MLVDERDVTDEMPANRWDAAYRCPGRLGPRKRPARWSAGGAGSLTGIDPFDADFFGIAPREAVKMDPQQLGDCCSR